jgi:HemY protein
MRALVALLVIAAAIAGAAFLADHPGHVEIISRDWQIDTSVGVLLGTAAIGGLAIWAVVAGLSALVRLPGRWRRGLVRRRRRRGEREIAAGLIAIAAGDASDASRRARQAARLVPEAPLSLLLSAQAAQLGDDRPLARRLYTAMLDSSELALVGLRGLLGQAVESGDYRAALPLAQRARQMRPDSAWLNRSLLALETRAGDWNAAAATLAAAAKRKLVPPERARHQRGVILHQLSLVAERDGDPRRAASLAAKAQALTPDLAEPAAHHARLLATLGRRPAALKAVERAWRTAPHPDLARLWGQLHDGETPLAGLRAFERLATANPQSAESHIAAAEAALDARLWGEARRHLGVAVAALTNGPTRRFCLLMARLEEGEYGPGASARDWLDRASNASPDPAWVCGNCGAEARQWHSLCPSCGAFDTLRWSEPTAQGTTMPSPRLSPLAGEAASLAVSDGLGGGGAMR